MIENGHPKVFYHGSPAQFTAFDKKKVRSMGHYGRGFYFSDSKGHAGTYGNTYSVYLNIVNPLKEGESKVTRDQVKDYLERIEENEDYSIENYGTYDIDTILDRIFEGTKEKDAFAVIQDINTTAIGDMVEAAKLFNEVNGTSFDGIIVPTETVAFEPEQIKSATWSKDLSGELDNIGTFSKYEADYPIVPAIKAKVVKALKNNGCDMHELSVITSEQNKDINRLTNIVSWNTFYINKL